MQGCFVFILVWTNVHVPLVTVCARVRACLLYGVFAEVVAWAVVVWARCGGFERSRRPCPPPYVWPCE